MNAQAIGNQVKTPDPYPTHRRPLELRFFGYVTLVVMALCSFRAQALESKDFVCDNGKSYGLNWDGWTGKLELFADFTGEFTSDGRPVNGKLITGGYTLNVHHVVAKNPQDDIEGVQSPGFIPSMDQPSSLNHRLVFWVDFTPVDPNNPSQRFDGYMRTTPTTQFERVIYGVTWWAKIPFAFSAFGCF